ncbi:hypothetical protein ACFSCW_03370 [Sphingomonas tabacisoli]|uniref:Uncharacterized protein n=1 Tax=Sphingomonas tabacisoli TaxID=2249466 RepID=A0ABW4HYV0_9SPHN
MAVWAGWRALGHGGETHESKLGTPVLRGKPTPSLNLTRDLTFGRVSNHFARGECLADLNGGISMTAKVRVLSGAIALACASSAIAQQTVTTPNPAVPATVPSGQVATAAAPVAAVAVAPAAAPVAATPAALQAVKVAAPTAGSAILPANTEVMLRLDEEVNSKRKRVGDTFRLTVLQDVMLGNFVVIPRGTPASGQISYRTGKGAFGKSAKMEITMNSINLNGRSIPITGNFRQEGEGNTGATVGVAVAAGVFSAFVTGKSAVFQSGREFRVQTREAIPVVLPTT